MSTPSLDALWIFICALLVMLQQVGFLCLETGFIRSKNSINVAVKNMADLTLVFVFFMLLGHWLFSGHSPIYTFELLAEQSALSSANFLLLTLYCCTTMTIVAGPVAERMRIQAYLILGIFTATLTFPLVAQWVWSEQGWLTLLGAKDFAGASVVHSTAGWIALAAIMHLGPRQHIKNRGHKYYSASNLGLSTLGCIFLWLGWAGFNAGSYASWQTGSLSVVLLTLFSGAIGGSLYLLSTLFTRNTRIEAGTFINCILAALVGITGAINELNLNSAIVFSIAGVASYFLVMHLLRVLELDDAIGAIPVHLGAGISGTLLIPTLSNQVLFINQLILVLAVGLMSFSASWLFLWLLNKVGVPLRVSQKQEEMGLNVVEHGATSDLYELINLMSYHQKTGDLSKEVEADPYTEAGLITRHYSQTVNSIRQANEKILTSERKANKANRAKSEFVANMSHEIRTPMNGVLGMAQLLSTTQLNEKQTHIVNTIRQSGKLLMSIINDILDFSKIESHKLTLHQVDCDLNELLNNILLSHQTSAQEKDLDLVLDISNLDDLIYNLDDVRLSQVLGNLIGNAIKFTDSGYVCLHCRNVSLKDKRQQLYFSVKDSGIGIDAEHQSNIFNPFTQEDSSVTRQFGGTGLGLSLSQSLVALMGGEIQVKSEKEHGSEFFFQLQCTSQSKEFQADNSIINFTHSDKTLLLLDDIEINHEVLAGFLELWKVNVLHFYHPDEALEKVMEMETSKEQLDYLILDYMMPQMNGLNFYMKAKSHLPENCKVMMLSSSDDMDVSEQALNLGIHEYRLKPLVMEQLTQFIHPQKSEHAPTKNKTENPPQPDITNLHQPKETVRPLAEQTSGKLPNSIDMDRFQNKHILVVEDNQINYMVIEQFLEDLNCRFQWAQNGEEAVKQYQAAQFDLVLMDCMLPILNGLEATRKIRHWETINNRPHTPVIALTADVTNTNKTQCQEAGMNDFMGKPFDFPNLLTLLDKWIA